MERHMGSRPEELQDEKENMTHEDLCKAIEYIHKRMDFIRVSTALGKNLPPIILEKLRMMVVNP